jgi:chromosome segregation ATPase
MSGTLILIAEIVIFMVLATAVGFGIGRLTRRAGSGPPTAEMASLRTRVAELDHEVADLTAQLVEARLHGDRESDVELEERAAMAEREAAGLERRLTEAVARVGELERERDEWIQLAEQAEAAAGTRDVDAGDGHDASEDVAALRVELDKRTAQVAHLERVANQAGRLEGELAAREDRIGDLEAALEARAASQASTDGDAAAIGISVGAANYADSRLTFDAWDPADAS